MKVIGQTSDGKRVVSGLFKLFDTHGLPLDIIFDLCEKRGLMPSWIDLAQEARQAGWTDATIRSRLSEALLDVYGKEFRDTVLVRLFGEVH